MRKITLFFLIAFATIGLSLPSQLSAKELQSNDNLPSRYTIEDYVRYLENYSPIDAKNGGVSEDEISDAVKESKEVLQEFQSLSKDEQQKFVDNLIFSDKRSLSIVTDDDINIIKPAADKSVSYSSSVKLFSIPVATYTVNVNYKVSKGKVKKINSSNARVKRNWNPIVRTDLNTNGKNAWVTSDNKAAVTGSFYYRIGPLKDLSVQIGNVNLKAVGDKNGKRTYAKTTYD
ncbi:hypothetical protein MOE90_20550 [Bacillus spizizenii]|nr:hypothetical protein [Bacillus spizizenii]MCY9124913.1 hypothetical protein [Bacillus spizizenii]